MHIKKEAPAAAGASFFTMKTQEVKPKGRRPIG